VIFIPVKSTMLLEVALYQGTAFQPCHHDKQWVSPLGAEEMLSLSG